MVIISVNSTNTEHDDTWSVPSDWEDEQPKPFYVKTFRDRVLTERHKQPASLYDMRQSARDSFGKDDSILENSLSKETKINRKPTKKVERSKSFLIAGFKDGHTVKNALKKSASILYPNWLSKKSVSRKIAETNSVTIKRGFDNSKEFIDTFDHMPQKSKSRTSSAYHSDEYPTNLDIEGNSDYDHPSTQVKSVYQKSNQFKSDQSFDLANANRIGIPDNGASSSLERRWRSMTTLNQSIPQREGTDEGRRRVLPQPGSKSRARSFYLVEDILKEAGFDFEKKSRSNQSLNNIRHSFRGKSRHGDSEESLSRSPPPIPPRRLNRPAQPLGDFSPPDLSPADDNSESNSSERHWPSEPQSTKPKENFSRGEQLETGGSSIPMDPLLLERLLKDRMAWRLYPVYYHDWALPPLLLVDCGCSHCKTLFELIKPVDERIEDVKKFLKLIAPSLCTKIVPIYDPFRPSISDPDLEMNENIPIHPHVIGLTGGIASGKSSIAKRLENLGVFIVDCDALGHRAYLPGTKCFKDVLQAFGDEIKDANGTINRKALGSIDALNKLNSIVWPQIAEIAKAEIKKLRTEGKDIVVLDAVVLLEANWNKFCQEVWVAIIPPEEFLEEKGARVLTRDMSRMGMLLVAEKEL
ncbi:hypothetical protein QYM36_017556 [Artemia franciscana]|uniref:Dephospho-CoA kinase n=1 Tax=Artemia franciscana TaxID=6661 RepID=A0AA88HER4_ARTSF|nr:hypothetical protein QYM36_017556 [Artemia franciscana]